MMVVRMLIITIVTVVISLLPGALFSSIVIINNHYIAVMLSHTYINYTCMVSNFLGTTIDSSLLHVQGVWICKVSVYVCTTCIGHA